MRSSVRSTGPRALYLPSPRRQSKNVREGQPAPCSKPLPTSVPESLFVSWFLVLYRGRRRHRLQRSPRRRWLHAPRGVWHGRVYVSVAPLHPPRVTDVRALQGPRGRALLYVQLRSQQTLTHAHTQHTHPLTTLTHSHTHTPTHTHTLTHSHTHTHAHTRQGPRSRALLYVQLGPDLPSKRRGARALLEASTNADALRCHGESMNTGNRGLPAPEA